MIFAVFSYTDYIRVSVVLGILGALFFAEMKKQKKSSLYPAIRSLLRDAAGLLDEALNAT